jgi:uncharacterized protein (DUF2252 family)
MEDIHRATRRYEQWLAGFMPLRAADLREKHRRMALGPFLFLRATYYRWCQLWRARTAEVGAAAPVTAVGDLHLENFGTWRDSDGRLIWGINDFDETVTLPWTQDLVRLAVSAHLAILADHLVVRRRTACGAILEGYRDGLAAGGRPFVLEETHGWLRRAATGELRHPTAFWERLNELPTVRDVDPGAAAAITAAMPSRRLAIRFARRVAGLGSLGRPRFVGIADWRGGDVAREAKATAPSAWRWACGSRLTAHAAYTTVLARAVRVPDPTVHVAGGWLVRRLAPHCSRIELADLPFQRDEERLLYAMGFETANVHLGTPRIGATLRRQLDARRGLWLHTLAKGLTGEVMREWKEWRAANGRGPRGGP